MRLGPKITLCEAEVETISFFLGTWVSGSKISAKSFIHVLKVPAIQYYQSESYFVH